MFKILIIDDNYIGSQTRKEVYQSILSTQFQISAVESSPQLDQMIQEPDIDLYLIDIVLTNWIDIWTGKALDTLDVLRKVKKLNKPIILISSEYENLVKNNQLTGFINKVIENDIYISSFITWGQFTTAHMEDDGRKQSIIALLKYEILKSRAVRADQKASKEIPIGIVTALSKELAPFLDNITTPVTTDFESGINFQLGTLSTDSGKNIKFVCACQDRMGMVDAAIVSTIMVNKYNVKHLFMIGVCGGRDSQEIKIGDLIIPNECITYQSGKIGKEGLVKDIGVSPSSGKLQQFVSTGTGAKAATIILETIFKKYQDNFFKTTQKYLADITVPVLKFSEMACGDAVIDQPGLLDKIATDSAKRKLCSVEMESYAVLRTHYYFKDVQASVLKSVMDLTNNKNDHYKDYAAYVAANFLFEVLKQDIYLL